MLIIRCVLLDVVEQFAVDGLNPIDRQPRIEGSRASPSCRGIASPSLRFCRQREQRSSELEWSSGRHEIATEVRALQDFGDATNVGCDNRKSSD